MFISDVCMYRGVRVRFVDLEGLNEIILNIFFEEIEEFFYLLFNKIIKCYMVLIYFWLEYF